MSIFYLCLCILTYLLQESYHMDMPLFYSKNPTGVLFKGTFPQWCRIHVLGLPPTIRRNPLACEASLYLLISQSVVGPTFFCLLGGGTSKIFYGTVTDLFCWRNSFEPPKFSHFCTGNLIIFNKHKLYNHLKQKKKLQC